MDPGDLYQLWRTQCNKIPLVVVNGRACKDECVRMRERSAQGTGGT